MIVSADRLWRKVSDAIFSRDGRVTNTQLLAMMQQAKDAGIIRGVRSKTKLRTRASSYEELVDAILALEALPK